MNKKVIHRGPDSGGVFQAENFALGSRRLSIIDLSPVSDQPMGYNGNVITYNGEIFNYRQLKAELEKKGFAFRTNSDTEVILAAFENWGHSCVQHFEGMWAFIVFDKRTKTLFASRDRFGQKPLIYTTVGNLFAMASEIKQFLDIPGFRAKLNHQVVFDFLNYASLNHNQETFFDDVKMLPAGYNLVFDLESNHCEIKQWYYFPTKELVGISMQEAATEFKRLFVQSVQSRLKADVKLGSCLSGGLDSSSIVCTIRELNNGNVHPVTISICWPGKDIDEQEYIDEVVRKFNCTSVKVYPEMDEMNAVLDRIIYHQDQPILSASHFAEYKVYEEAGRQGIRVMMDGQGADEYLAGYQLFQLHNVWGLARDFRLRELGKEWKAIKTNFGYSHEKLLRSLLYLKYKRKERRLRHVYNQSWVKNFDNSNPAMLPLKMTLGIRNFTNHQLFISSLPYQLHSADRNSMCHSVEARLPFLDHRLVEFTSSLPSNFKISQGRTKLVLRQALKNVLPEKIFNRQSKQAFPAPEKEWMQSNCDWIRGQISESAELLGKVLNYNKVNGIFKSVCDNTQENYSLIFRVVTLNKFLRLFNFQV